MAEAPLILSASYETVMTPPKICWDTSVYLAWLNNESTAPIAEIDEILQEIYANRVNLIFPVLILSEILTAKHTPEQSQAFEAFLDRSSVMVAEHSIYVARKAEQIRSRALTIDIDGTPIQEGQERRIKTPDASIMATAILYGADALHTLEPKLLRLSKSPIVEGLNVTAPVSPGGPRKSSPPRKT